MNLAVQQISSMEKVRSSEVRAFDEIRKMTVMQGERFSYQLCVYSDTSLFLSAKVNSPLADFTKLFQVKDVPMDTPVTEVLNDIEDYITLEPSLMPDLLLPLEATSYHIFLRQKVSTLWVKVDVPKDMLPGTYSIKIEMKFTKPGQKYIASLFQEMIVHVVPTIMPEQQLIYTRWLYVDCIANAHNVEIYSEKHWELIEKYIEAAVETGINMILVPTHTPPLDTEIGTARPCVQLVDIEKTGDKYHFDFSKFKRYIDLCHKKGIKYFEIAHMFSQWGAKCAPNIQVTVNGHTDYLFGWHVASNSTEYVSFLKQYVTAISEELLKEGISEYTYFHISDEPSLDNIESYKISAEIIRPLIGNCKTFDALSNYKFYERGLVECPVTCVNHIHEFLDHDIDNQWAYYCCEPQKVFPNSFIAMPSYRIRILGFLLYKYDIKGFLHWGFNFYNATRSLYSVNPYITTSCESAFPSGDPFIVYPGENCVYGSIRGEIMYEAIQDMNVCFALEKIIGREAVIQMIDATAGYSLRFDHYPRNNEFFDQLRSQMIETIISSK